MKHLIILFLLAGCAKVTVIEIKDITVKTENKKAEVIIVAPDPAPESKEISITVPSADSYQDRPICRREPEEEDDFLKHIRLSNNYEYDAYIIHIVGIWKEGKMGGCLWDIAIKYYDNGNDYMIIYQANSEKIENPDLIYPKQELKIPLIKQ